MVHQVCSTFVLLKIVSFQKCSFRFELSICLIFFILICIYKLFNISTSKEKKIFLNTFELLSSLCSLQKLFIFIMFQKYYLEVHFRITSNVPFSSYPPFENLMSVYLYKVNMDQYKNPKTGTNTTACYYWKGYVISWLLLII